MTKNIARVPLNVTQLIDERPIGARQVIVYGLCALVNFMDGTDNLALAATARSIATDLDVPLAAFGIVFSVSNLGAVAGAILFGILADTRGRKFALLMATLVFSVLTFATPFAIDLPTLLIIRFIGGLGIGGALPCLLALAAEFTPARRRRTIVPVVFAGQSVGLMFGGFLNAYLLGRFGWHTLYYIDAVLGLAIVGLCAVLLPESIRYTIDRRRDQSRAQSLVQAIAPNVDLSDRMLIVAPEGNVNVSVVELFRHGLALQTLVLWTAFIFSFGAIAAMTQWTPALLSLGGTDAASAARTVSFGGAGSIIGLLVGGAIAERRQALWCMFASLLAAGACIAQLGFSLGSPGAAHWLVLAASAFISIALAGLLSFSATVYPDKVRSTGVGFAVASSRAGNVGGLALAGALLGAGISGTGVMLTVASFAGFAALSAAALVFAIGAYRSRVGSA